MKLPVDLENLTCQQSVHFLKLIVTKLDSLDCDEFFGLEGWKYFFELDK